MTDSGAGPRLATGRLPRGDQASPGATVDVIEVEGLVKKYEEVTAVDGISFAVREGEVFGILGPNGAGKTTTLECIEGLIEPTAGKIRVLGMDLAPHLDRIKGLIGVQLQASAYFDYLTLQEILDLLSRFYGVRPRSRPLLERMGLRDKARTTADKLSGGQRQRFAIAAALVNDPRLLFLDEPTTGLDPQARRSIWDLVRQLNGEGRTVVLTTHYMEEAQYLCHRVAIMDRGRIVALDTPLNLIRSLPTPYEVRALLRDGTVEGLDRLAAVKGVEVEGNGLIRLRSADAARSLPDLLRWAQDRGARLEHLEVVTANLEDVFLALTGRALRD